MTATLRRDRLPAMVAPTGAAFSHVCGCGAVLRFALSYDAKTSPAVTLDARGRSVSARATIPNAWNLPAGPVHLGGACPGSTDACRDCYGAGQEARYTNTGNLVTANLDNLRHVYGCGGRRAVVDILTRLVNLSAGQQRAAGITRPSFRWHADGDIFAAWYARAIRETATATPGVDQWIYTRSTMYVRELMPAPDNLRVIVSVDQYNATTAARVAARYGLPVAILAPDKATAADIFARVDRAGRGSIPAPVLCPVAGAYKDGSGFPTYVVGVDGKRSSLTATGAAVGACIACGLCLPGGANRSVTFLIHGGTAAPGTGGRLAAAVAVRVRRGVIAAA
jgi:hypothetical protein